MNTKKIIIILGIIVIFLTLIFLLMNLLPRNQSTEGPIPTITSNPNLPTGIVVPTRDIAPGGFDIVSVEPQDQATNIPLDQIITITFNREFQENEIAFNISPPTPYRTYKERNKLIIFPQTTWETGTPYSYSVNFTADNEKVRLYGFTTTGPTPEFLPDTQPEGAYEEEQERLKNNNPDIYVTNQTPYEATSFKIESNFETQPPEHFYFIVTPKIEDDAKVREDVILWLQLLDLTDQQIQSLDIRYQ